jgi:NDP-sugar pyrophosphorylase family protein
MAGGRGERMMPLTADTPKSLLRISGIPIIDYIFASLPEGVDEVIVVIKYLGNQIKDYLRTDHMDKKVRYITASDKGIAYSLLKTSKYLKNERFILIYGDEIPNPVNVKRCLEEDLSVLTFDFGKRNGVMVLNTDIFDYRPTDFNDMLTEFMKDNKVILVEAEDFIGEINTIRNLKKAERKLHG